MMRILHGDDEVKIHAALSTLLSDASTRHVQVERLDAKRTNFNELESLFGTDQLFAIERLVVIDGLLGLPKSKAKDELMDLVACQPGGIVCVEKKIATPAQLKKFPRAKIELYRLPALLFSWLEQLGTIPKEKSLNDLPKVLAVSEDGLVFAMLIRQVRQLLLAISGGKIAGAPFMIQKLHSQAKHFSEEKLLKLHEELLVIDRRQKTSTSALSLSGAIALWVSEL